MKKKILLLASVAICIAILTTGTLAYFTAEGKATNVITTGAVNIAVEEWQQTENGLVPYPDEPVEVMPGITLSKIVTVKNLDAAAWIRGKFDVVLYDAAGKEMELTPETISSIISITADSEHWQRKEGDSEWWYYADAVTGGKTTEAFFAEVVFVGDNMTNEYQGCTAKIIVTAQAVQQANNGESVMDAAGWPEA